MLGHRYRNHDRYRDGYRDRDRQKKEKGTGKAADGERRRCFEIAQGSAWECAAIEDVRVVGKALDEAESENRKTELDPMAAMLSRLGGRGYPVREKAWAGWRSRCGGGRLRLCSWYAVSPFEFRLGRTGRRLVQFAVRSSNQILGLSRDRHAVQPAPDLKRLSHHQRSCGRAGWEASGRRQGRRPEHGNRNRLLLTHERSWDLCASGAPFCGL